MTKSSLPHKAHLISRTLPALMQQGAYFSIEAVKRSLINDQIELADSSLRKYLSQAMHGGVMSNAGRGWYSRHISPVSLDPKPVAKIIREVKRVFPLLDFCCWSTVQFNPFALHLVAQPTIFLYAEEDTLESVGTTLRESSWEAWVNPNKSDSERFIRPGATTVVLRPSITKQPTSSSHVASIEKALVDLFIETYKLQLMDQAEVQRILDSVLSSGLLKLPVLFSYAETKRVSIESKELVR